MATITEASHIGTLLRAVTGHGDHQPTADQIAAAMRHLEERAAKALQISSIVPGVLIDEAAVELAQRNADRLGGEL